MYAPPAFSYSALLLPLLIRSQQGCEGVGGWQSFGTAPKTAGLLTCTLPEATAPQLKPHEGANCSLAPARGAELPCWPS